MFNVEACYKIIFEALFEQQGLQNVVEKVHDHTQAFVCLVLKSGEIIACVRGEQEMQIESIRRKHVTFRDYDLLQVNIRKTEEPVYIEHRKVYVHISEFEVGGKRIGYSILSFKGEREKDKYVKVNEILCQAAGLYLKDFHSEVCENIPMRRQICAWTIFSGEKIEMEEMEMLKEEIPGQYFLIFIPCRDEKVNKQRIFQQIQGIWNESFYEFGEDYLCALFFAVDAANREMIVSKVKKIGYPLCASELFIKLSSCSQKREFLKRMDKFDGYHKNAGVMEEKEWYVETVFSYAKSMFAEAGLNDYSIELLCKEDAEKNLELYYTLKMYLMCENNISATAAKLHVHRNTLVYRLKQIQNCIGKDINDSRVSKELLSYMIMYDIVRKTEK